jgi:hypothetical protein
MRAFNLLVIHNNIQAYKDVICKACSFLDPDPYWNHPTTCYSEEQFTKYYDQSIIIDEDADWTEDNLADRAWGIHAQCSESFYAGIDLWGNPSNDDYFKTLLGVDDSELATLKSICTWEKVDTYIDTQFPVTATAQAAGYDLDVNYDQTWLDAKKAELGYG